tara:strand:- start:158 stop:5872 length:5715 start_codon:yes stop_codon:yes gene_type:complete
MQPKTKLLINFVVSTCFLVFISLHSYAQCPSPNNNFVHFATGTTGLTPATINSPVQAASVWGGNYVQVNVVSGRKYKISQANSGAIVAAAFPTNIGASVIGFDPIMTVLDNTGVDGNNGAVVAFNDDANGTRFPELEYTATYTGQIFVHIDPKPSANIYNGWGTPIANQETFGDPAKLQTDGSTVTCDNFVTDSTAVVVTRLPLGPGLTIADASSITGSSATISAEVTSDGGSSVTARGLIYALTATNSNPQIGGTGVTQEDKGTGLGVISSMLSGLTPDTQYSYAGYATNTDGTTYSTVKTFTTLEITPPVVQSIAVNGTPATNATSISFDVTFDEAASNVTQDDFVVDGTGVTGNITGISGSGTSYTVTVGSVSGTGTLSVDLKASTDIVDVLGNGNGTNGSVAAFTTGANHTVDTDAPAFENSTPSTSNLEDIYFALNVDINESGTVYYAVMLDGETAPTSAELKSGVSCPIASGSIALNSDPFSGFVDVIGVSASTAYDVYVVAEDASGNLQTSPTKIDVTTATASKNFRWTSATGAGTVTETVDGVTATVTTSGTTDAQITNNAFLNQAAGTVYNVVVGNTPATEMNVAFSSPMDLTAIKLANFSATANWVLTPTGGSNSVVNVNSFTAGSGAIVVLNWVGVTSFTITVDNSSNASFIIDEIVVTTTPSVSFNTTSSSGLESVPSANLAVGLSAASASTVTVDYAVTGGTATGSGTDYTLASGTLTFNPSSTSENIMASIVGELMLEANETVIVTLSNPTNATLGTNTTHTYTINNDDTASVTIADISGNENDGAITVTATLDNPVQGGFTVDVSTVDGTATVADSDYTAVTSQTLTFVGTVGETQTFSVTPTGDTKLETDETLSVTQSSLAATSLSVDITDGATVTIDNDDSAAVTIEDVSGNEDDGAITLTATLDNPVQDGVTLSVSTTDGTATLANNDYTALVFQQISFTGTAGETKTFTVTPTVDTTTESNETISVSMQLPDRNSQIVDVTDTATVTILNDDSASLTVDNVDMTENAGGATTDFTFTVTLTGSVDAAFSVDYGTSDVFATAGTDYVATTGRLTFAGTNGETQQLTVTVNNDDVAEFNESFAVGFVNLQAGGRPITIPNPAIGTIINDDIATITIADVSGNEDDGAITVTATLDKEAQDGVIISVSTTDGSATIANSDYTAIASQQISFTGTAGETKTFTVTPTVDTTTEFDETLVVSMQLPQRNGSARVDVSDTATITITNDDLATITIEDVSGNEDDGPITLTATLDNDIQNGFTISVSTADGTATLANNDYTAVVSQHVTFAGTAGETQTFTVTPTADAITESDETISIFMQIPTRNNSIVDVTDTATVTILDDDAPVITAVSAPTDGVYGIGSNLDFTATFSSAVTITGSPSIPITIGSTTLQATVSGTVNGATTATFRYTVVEDDLDTDGIAVGTDILLNGGTIEDASNRAAILTLNNVASTTNIDVDGVKPTVVITSTVSDPTNAAYDVTITFSEVVTGLDLSDLDVGNGTASNLTGSGAVYTATITPTGDGGVITTVFDDLVIDLAGNGNKLSNEFFVEYDATNPTVAITTTAVSPVNAPFDITITFSEDVTGFDITDLGVANGTAGNFNATSATVYTATITPTADADITLDIAAGAAQDAATNGNNVTQFIIEYDSTPPLPPQLTHISDYTCVGNVAMTGDNTLEISGTAEAGSSVEVFEDGTSIGIVTATNAGFFTFDHTGTTLADGTYNFTVTATDIANNTSALSAPLTITINSLDTDGDGLPDFCDDDKDGNGVDDVDEDCDGDGIVDHLDTDNSACSSAILETKQYGFSPNGDGINDGWFVENITAYPNSLVQVFNRSGKLVFKKKGYQNDWQGDSNQISSSGTGVKLPVGPYLFIIDLGDGSQPTRGWIYINY